ncbi:sporulation protein YpjB [Paenibacillus sp. TRM 82003]|nr:sporulation protein YpjB [Paenibacillus sp. TRM 82003]
MFTKGRLRRYALLLIGAAVTFVAAVGCGQTEPAPQPETKKVVTDMQRQTMQQMNEAAEAAYQSMQVGDAEETRARLAQLSVLSTKLPYEGITTVEGIEAVTGAIADAMHALNGAKPDPVDASVRVAGARLAVDALMHREQPMWLEFHKPLSSDLEAMDAAAVNASDPEASKALAMWRGHVSIVRPAIVVSRDAGTAVQLDSITAFLEEGVRTANWSGIVQALPGLEQALGNVFDDEDRETVSPLLPTAEPPHPILWSLVLGAFIVAVLGYVAWRRYEADQGVVRVKRERDFDANA